MSTNIITIIDSKILKNGDLLKIIYSYIYYIYQKNKVRVFCTKFYFKLYSVAT